MDYIKRAEKYFNSGCNCAQSVIMPFASDFNVDLERAFEIGSGLGGGVAGTHKNICGALNGMLIVAGWIYGKWDVNDSASKAKMTDFMKKLYDEFCNEYSTVCCQELKDKLENEKISNYSKPCFLFVEKAVKILINNMNSEE